ncbi:MAG: peptidase S8 [Candidatus Sericytochromatia bacterium]|nr:peptidase S8 [Candidatus Tanganyikabacteria bacterium]
MRFSVLRALVPVSAFSLLVAGCGTSPVAGLGAAVLKQGSGSLYLRNGEAQVLVKRRPGGTLSANLAGLSLRPASVGRSLAGMGWQMVSLPAANVGAAVSAFRGDPAVLAVQPNYQRNLIRPRNIGKIDVPGTLDSILPGLGTIAAAQPNDPGYKRQYAPQRLQAPDAWPISTGKGIVTAIVDTGVDTGHPDLQAHMVAGWNTVSNSADAKDDHGHGTHVAGITAALANNKEGIVGIAPDAAIMPIKVLDGDGSGSDETVASGIIWAADHGAKVINLSLGGAGESQVLGEAVAYALKKGASVVAAMGNDGTNEKSYPAAYPGVVAVGATDKADKIASFSQWGDWISVSAPGVAVYSTFPTYKVAMNDYGFPMNYASLDGTSMATPAVAGAVAVLRAKFAALDPAQVRARLQATTDKVAGQGDFDQKYGYGRINVLKSLK